MLKHEWITVFKSAVKERLGHDADDSTAMRWFNLANHIYLSRRGDFLFTGLDRHEKLARWFLANQKTAMRLARFVNRKPQAELDRLRQQVYDLNARIGTLTTTIL